jgi:hypothetical protein
MRLTIETEDTVREINRWEIPNVEELIPDWADLTLLQRRDRIAELIGEGAEFCRNLEADTLERDIIGFQAEIPPGSRG